MAVDGDFASFVIADWRQGTTPDAQQVVVDHPELGSDKSTVLQLAYEEFCLRTEAGEKIDSNEFCARFPRFQTSLARMLEVHHYFADNPEMLAPDSLIRWPEIGESIVGFTIVQELGRGGIARVFLAREETLGNRTVVIKISKGGSKEADTLGRLVHPNIVPVHSVQEDPKSGLTVVCMPYLGQTTLCDVLDRAFRDSRPPEQSNVIIEAIANDVKERSSNSKLPSLPSNYIDAVIEFAIQLADGLAYTHSLNILHRDLKPSNILVGPSGELMLLDFNLSTDSASERRPLGGTLPYMAPEQLLAVFFPEAADGTAVDARSDIFSLGVVLYELLTGTRPFGLPSISDPTAETAEKLLREITAGATPIRERNPNVDYRAADIIRRCLADCPQQRFQSATELVAVLRNHRSKRLSRWAHRHVRALASAGTIVAVVVLLAVVFMVSRLPLSVREFKLGLADYSQSAYTKAAERFGSVVAAEPTSTAAHFARGQALLHVGDYDAAIEDFKKIQQNPSDGRVMACLAYCYGRSQNHPNAILRGQQAVSAGFGTPAVLNNLGYSYLKSARWNQAKQCFDKAIESDPHFGIAYHNRVRLDLQLALRDGNLPANIMNDLDMALSLNPNGPWLFLDAAYVYAIAGGQRPDMAAKAFGYLRHATQLGLDSTAFTSDPLFLNLWQEPEFSDLLRTTSSAQPNPPVLLAIPYDSAELQ